MAAAAPERGSATSAGGVDGRGETPGGDSYRIGGTDVRPCAGAAAAGDDNRGGGVSNPACAVGGPASATPGDGLSTIGIGAASGAPPSSRFSSKAAATIAKAASKVPTGPNTTRLMSSR